MEYEKGRSVIAAALVVFCRATCASAAGDFANDEHLVVRLQFGVEVGAERAIEAELLAVFDAPREFRERLLDRQPWPEGERLDVAGLRERNGFTGSHLDVSP